MITLELALLPDRMAVCRLPPGDPVPAWVVSRDPKFWSVTHTAEEMSVVCAEQAVPPGTRCESGWRILRVAGPLDFSLTGILLAVARPLAEAGISIFAISTFDTDYVIVREHDLEVAVRALEAAGHSIDR